jgi:hypothetical protein
MFDSPLYSQKISDGISNPSPVNPTNHIGQYIDSTGFTLVDPPLPCSFSINAIEMAIITTIALGV